MSETSEIDLVVIDQHTCVGEAFLHSDIVGVIGEHGDGEDSRVNEKRAALDY